MSTKVIVVISCDLHGCTNEFEQRVPKSSEIAQGARVALVEAMEQGWRHQGSGHDLCPEHVKNTMVTPVRES